MRGAGNSIGRIARCRWRQAGAALTVVWLAVAPAHGADTQAPAQVPAADCKGINGGALHVALEAAASSARRVSLKAGDALTFAFATRDGSLGSVTLLGAAGPERLLLVGPAGTSVTFVAPRAGAFAFRFAKDGPEAAEFSAACTPAKAAAGAGRRAQARAGRRAAEWMPAAPDAGALGLPAVVTSIDPAAPGQGRDARPAAPGLQAPPAAQAADHLAAGNGDLALQLEWRDARFAAAGPEGPHVDGNASGVNLGLNYKLQPAIMLGALAQFEQAGEAVVGLPGSLAEHGWMAGPVTTVKLGPGLSLDARAAWGFADGGPVDLAGSGGPSLPRRLLSARLANTQTFGHLRITPSVNFNHVLETQLAPAPSAMQAFMPTTVSSGRLDIGPEFAYRFDLASSAFIEPRAAIGSFWGIDGLTPAAHADMRLKAEAGVTFGVTEGPKLQVGGAVEEGGRSVPDVWSGRLQMSVPLQ
jgi:hypothetical protein